MPRTLSYVDAVRLLGGEDDQLLRRLDALAGGVLLAVTPAVPAVLALLDAKREVARLGHDLIRRLQERRAGLSRFDRTQRLAAAHTVLVVSAYFEVMAEADLPLRFADLELTKFEQVAIAGHVTASDGGFLNQVLAAGTTLPAPHGTHELYERELDSYYTRLSSHVERFLNGLMVWENMTATQRGHYLDALHQLPQRAVRRYGEYIRSLAADFPEVAAWVNMLEHEATRDAVRRLEPSLAQLERQLRQLSSGRVSDEQARSVARAHRAALSRPIAESGDVPTTVSVPTLERAYLAPRYRLTDVEPQGGPSNEAWWENVEVRDDLEDFLIRYLTSARATEAPILVLGQPGAGKSVLTRVLAARLPSSDFLVVRIPLRDVAAELDVQGQIEQAIHQVTGERLRWPALVRSNPDALPVVLIDGFDELLQATGVRQTDYLIRVADFQRREADLGRPVAVIVTTRTSVADRARTPPDTLLLRLEPFDPNRIRVWVKVWNETNAANFPRAGIQPLDTTAVMNHLELAGQPLLLLMLALYDADNNALARLSSGLQRTELYEQLLQSFAQREIVKHRPEISPDELAPAIEQEMRRLSIVAFAMFNRASQWVTEADLELDLIAIFGTQRAPSPPSMRAVMRSAELTLGRFFFVHRARAQRDETSLHTYEFLHATFGEFLVARLTWQVAMDTLAREHATTLPTGGVDDELMYALLSWAPLTARRPVVEFLLVMAAGLADAPRRQLARLLIGLVQTAGLPRSGRVFESYRPRQLTVSARHAAYSASILFLAVAVRGSLKASEVYGSEADQAVTAWRSQALLWQSQLGDEFSSLVDTLSLERVWDHERRDIRLTIDDGSTEPADVDPLWTYRITNGRGNHIWNYMNELALRRRVNFLCRGHTDAMLHALEPVLNAAGPYAVSRFYSIFPDQPHVALSRARALLEVWLMATDDRESADREAIYVRCVTLCLANENIRTTGDKAEPSRFITLLLTALSADHRASLGTALVVIESLIQEVKWLPALLSSQLAACVLAFLLRLAPTGGERDRLESILAVIDPELVESGVRRQLLERAGQLGLSLWLSRPAAG